MSAAKKTFSLMLAVALVFGTVSGIFPVTTAHAAGAASLEATLESYTGGEGASGSLSAAVEGSTVTVTGSITNAAETLLLEIDAGVTVVWKASIESAKSFSGTVISLFGAGTFEVTEGAAITGTGYTIATGGTLHLKVSGGTVESGTTAIFSTGDDSVITVSGGTVTGGSELGIYAVGERAAVTVSAGTVQTVGNDTQMEAAILMGHTTSRVTVNGTGVVRVKKTEADIKNAGGIYAAGAVEIGGSAAVSGAEGGGDAIVLTAANASAVINGGTVSGVGGSAIWGDIYSAVSVTVNGGTVVSQNSPAIRASGAGSTVTVNGGKVLSFNTGISETIGSPAVAVNGGLVFGYGTAVVGSYQIISSSSPSFADAGVAIAWNQKAENTSYTAGTTADIVISPGAPAATAVWGTQGSEGGIYYANGANTGFIPLEVTVTGGAGGPMLLGGTATRTSETEAKIGFSTTEEGIAYYRAVEQGADAPVFDASSWTSLGTVSGVVTEKSVALTAGAKDVYVVVSNAQGGSAALKISVGAAFSLNHTVEVYVGGNTDVNAGDIVGGISPSTGLTIKIQPNAAVAIASKIPNLNYVRISGVAAGETSMVVSVDGLDVTVPIRVVEPPEDLRPVLSNGTAERTGDTTATVRFTTDKPGRGFYLVKVAGETEPAWPYDFVEAGAFEVETAGSAEISVVLTAGAKDVYIIVAENVYSLPSRMLKIEVPAYVPPLAGTAVIDNTAPKIGDMLIASLQGGIGTGTLSYTWKADGAAVGTDSFYMVTAADLGKTITVTITSSAESGEAQSAPTAAVTKRTAPAAPDAPVLINKTKTGVTLAANAAYEYSMNGTTWQPENIFTGLTPDTPYTFYQRVAETEDTLPSATSEGLPVTTDALVKSVSVGAQTNLLTAGTAGAADFMVVTSDIEAGAEITLNNTSGVEGVALVTTATTGESTTVRISINESTPHGGHRMTLTIDGITSDAFMLYVDEFVPVYDILLSTASHTFPATQEGYGAQEPLSVTVTNTGNQSTATLNIELSGTDSGSFTLSKNSISDIAIGGNDSFTVAPKTGLVAKTYTAAVTVSGTNGISENFDVSFTVTAAPVLSNEKDVITVTSPELAQVSGTTIAATVLSDVESLPISLTVSDKASWKLYSDAACTTEITDRTMALSVGENTAYVQVTAEDGSAKVYTLTVTRQAPPVFPVPATSISITGGSAITVKNGSVQLFAEVLPENATNRAVTWSITSGGGFATISTSGLVTATANGTVTVRAAAQDGSNVYEEKTISISGQGGAPAPNPDPDPSPTTLTDNPTSITVSGYISEGAVLTVTDLMLGNSTAEDAIRQRMNDDDYMFILGKNISLSGSFTGTLTLSLPVGAQYNGKTVTILHAKQDGTLETYTVVVRDGKATFDVTSLSPFAVFTDAKDALGIPKTGDGSAVWAEWMLMALSGAGISAVVWTRKRSLQKR